MSGKLVSLMLTNFRQHERWLVTFSPEVTVLVGRNDVGKSTVLNAVRWIAFNRPISTSMIRWGQKGCSAKLTTEACEVTRTRGSENTYQIDDDEPFRAVGSDVPKDVQDALRLDQINFQRQIDGPFWLTMSAPEIAREMNQIVDLSIIDTAMGNTASYLRDATSQVKALTGLVSEARARVGRLRWAEDVEAEAREALQCEQEAVRKRQEAETISRVVEQIEEAQEASGAILDLSEAEPLVARLHEIQLESGTLNKILTAIDGLESDLCELREEMKRTARELEKAKPETCGLCGQVLPSGRSS